MKRLFRWLGIILAAILVLLLIFVAWVWFASARVLGRTHEAAPERLAAPTAAQLADGERQARILGCVNCHGEGLRGRMMFDAGPFAKVWAPNLNELAARASDQQLAQAIRQGVGHDGRALYIMPSAMYSRLSDQEVAGLIAWIRRLPRAGERTSAIQWGPIGRFALATGGLDSMLPTIEDFRIRQPFDTGREHQAGRRLAATVCSECHGADLTGGQPMPDAIPPDLSIVGAYNQAQFVRLMRTGLPPNGRDLGLMAEIARNNTSHMTDDELAELYAYLSARAQRVAR